VRWHGGVAARGERDDEAARAAKIRNERHIRQTPDNTQWSSFKLSKIRWTIREPCISQVYVRCIVPKRVTHRFATHPTCTHSIPTAP
jgi:hypothetical protein